MTPQFESELSGAVRSSVPALQNVEKRRCNALMGPTDIQYRDKEWELPGGKSDASYHKRLHFRA
jgi:hypothetical protein